MFPSLWSRLEDLITSESVYSCEEVLKELNDKDDALKSWATIRKTMFFKPSGVVIAHITNIMKKFPNFAASGGSHNRADPWVIAQALATEGTVVVTDEHPSTKQKPTKPPKIPDVCDALGIKWATPIDFLRAVGIDL